MAAPMWSAAGRYVDWGVIQISVTNLVIIGLMIAIFVAALLVPFPGGSRHDDAEERDDGRG